MIVRHTEQGKREAGQEMRAKPGKAGGYCQSATLFEMERNMNELDMINALIDEFGDDLFLISGRI